MTAESITSPPTSPPSKRVKTSNDNSITDAMAENGSASVPTPQLEQSPPLFVKKLSDKARLPTRGSAFAAGYDIYSSQAATVPARGKVLVDTDISVALPAGTCTSSPFPPASHRQQGETGDQSGHPHSRRKLTRDKNPDGRVAPRSGLASKHSIQTGAGVIDADYRGQLKVLLFNLSDVAYEIAEGDRIAQLVIERIYTPDVVEVAELEASVRGAGGFGSTGTN